MPKVASPLADSVELLSLACFTGTPVPDNPKVKLENLEPYLEEQRDDLVRLIQSCSPVWLPVLPLPGASAKVLHPEPTEMVA